MLLPEAEHLWLFLVAAISIAVLPGPAIFYIVARSIAQGRLAGLISVLGIGGGGLFHVAAASLGVSAIVLASATAFSLLKYAGAAYLIFLGLQILRAKQDETRIEAPKAHRDMRKVFVDGVLVNIFNPKTALFFMAFLPQFVTPGLGSISIQMVSLGLLFVLIALVSDSAYVLAADGIYRYFRRGRETGHRVRFIAAGIYILLGISTLFVGDSSETPA